MGSASLADLAAHPRCKPAASSGARVPPSASRLDAGQFAVPRGKVLPRSPRLWLTALTTNLFGFPEIMCKFQYVTVIGTYSLVSIRPRPDIRPASSHWSFHRTTFCSRLCESSGKRYVECYNPVVWRTRVSSVKRSNLNKSLARASRVRFAVHATGRDSRVRVQAGDPFPAGTVPLPARSADWSAAIAGCSMPAPPKTARMLLPLKCPLGAMSVKESDTVKSLRQEF
jgi:hypothetical protein